MMSESLNLSFRERKALAALALIARTSPGLTPLYVAKIMYFAERWHINRFGRPIVADDYIAMPQGPVPSAIKNFIDENWNWVERPELIEAAITIDHSYKYARLMPGGGPVDDSCLSPSDRKCLEDAIRYCVSKTAAELSDETHQHAAWKQAQRNRSMDYRLFIDEDNPFRDDILQALEESVYSVL